MFCWFRHVRASVFAVPAFLAAINPAFAAPGDLDAAGFGAGTGKILTAIGPAYDRAAGIALQPDGKIIVAGPCRNDNNDDFCVARYLPGGALDTSFNGTGTALAAIGASDDIATAVALQPDGKVVVAGYCFNGGRYDFCVSRHLTTGAIDTSFDGTGRVMTTIGTAYSMALTLMLQPDGKIVVAGVCSNGGNNDFCLARYLTSGALDTSFNGTGKVLTPIGLSDDTANAIALQSDGRIVVAGFCLGGGADFCLARYMTDGTLDTTFGSTGKTFTSFGASDDNVYSIALQPDGKIVVAGECRSGGSADFCLARYQRDGALDRLREPSGRAMLLEAKLRVGVDLPRDVREERRERVGVGVEAGEVEGHGSEEGYNARIIRRGSPSRSAIAPPDEATVEAGSPLADRRSTRDGLGRARGRIERSVALRARWGKRSRGRFF